MELPELDALIHQRTRLQVMTLLFRNREAAFAWVRDQLDLTWGNLDGHADRLQEAGYLERDRVLTSDGFEVRLRLTDEGRTAFRTYLDQLERYQVDGPGGPAGPESTEGLGGQTDRSSTS